MFTTLQPPHGLLQFCRVMGVVITLFSSATFSSAIPYQLHPDEVTALKQIDKTLTQGGQPLELSDACTQDSEANSTSVCNCTLNLNNDSYCHITSLSLKTLNFQGKLPSEMVNLTYLKYLSLEANQFSGTIPSQLGDLVNLTDLRASDNNLSGRIPDFIGKYWSYLDRLELYASGLQGPIPNAILSLEKLTDLFLSGNKLNGSVPDSFLKTDKNIDVSYNNFSWLPSCRDARGINTYRSSLIKNNLSGLLPCSGIHKCPKSYRSFHVNCGGPDITSGSILYKGDGNSENNAAMMYYNQGSNWGFSNTGDFMDDNDEGPGYILHSNYWNEPLFSTARRAAISLTYYGYCLENGMYTVKLDFAEIQFTDDELYKRVGKRYFDIYIQGKLEKPDFNIQKAANGSNKASIVFNASVTDTTLEIRLYWNGKGTTCIPKRGNYGPLISAITVCSGQRTYCPEPGEASKIPIVVGVVTSALLLVFLVMGVICWKFYFRDKFMRER
ncbi:hypothetical protein D5086_021604, partial [Populus alba]